MNKRLRKSFGNRKIAGVCGGLGEYLDVDPTIIRIVFLASALLGGASVIIYLVMLVIMPD